jgi:hypothetical protein
LGLATFRARAVVRFRAHIERWLEMTRQRLHGGDAIPSIGAQRSADDDAMRESPAVDLGESKRSAAGR